MIFIKSKRLIMAKIVIRENFIDDLIGKFYQSLVDNTEKRYIDRIKKDDPELAKLFDKQAEAHKKTQDAFRKAIERASGKR
jgi:ABC-type enterochelin transport system substrate-binding protein